VKRQQSAFLLHSHTALPVSTAFMWLNTTLMTNSQFLSVRRQH